VPAWPRRAPAAAGAFAALALLVSWPLAAHLGDALPGPPGDNVAFLWNFWWMRAALGSGASVFHTPYLFAPAGIDLTLNTHSALPAFLGATLLAPLSEVAAQNVVTLAALALNGVCAWRLARRFTDDEAAAWLGGAIFATSAFISSHLLGHFNLTSAFVLPLFATACLGAARGSVRAGIATGLVLAGTAFIDYYYVVYEIAIGACLLLLAAADWSIGRRVPGRLTRRISWGFAAASVVTLAAIAAIAATGGFAVRVGGRPISMRTIYNPLQIFWVFALGWLLLRVNRTIVVARRPSWTAASVAPAILAAGGVFLLSAAPLVWRGIRLMTSGDYVSQRYFWRSAPSGVDLSTLVLGNPLHPLWGHAVLGVYGRLGLSQTESLAWLGVAPLALAALAVARRGRDPGVRIWLAIGAVFFVWALGPHLRIAGADTGLILPQTLLRYVPIASNARMPARAMVLVNLAVAVLAAIAAADLRRRASRPALVLACLTAAVIADQLPAPFPLLPLARPHIYETLRDRPEPGSLCELPMGIADGFGQLGALDPRELFYQTIHHRPIAGGMISRLPVSVRRLYESDAILHALMQLSEPDAARRQIALPDRQTAIAALRASHFAFVMLNRSTASPELAEYVERVLTLRSIAREGERELYVVEE
jgi:hypothetical protein